MPFSKAFPLVQEISPWRIESYPTKDRRSVKGPSCPVVVGKEGIAYFNRSIIRQKELGKGFKMFVKMFTVGMLGTNCYLVGDTDSHEALIIDPGFDNESEAKTVLKEVERNDFEVKYIVDTHGHSDHTSGNQILKEATKAPILVHEYDAPLLSNPKADRTLRDGDIIEVGSVKLRVIHTPGHSRGSIILLSADTVFSGDTLFAGSIGRFDLPGGSIEEIKNSLRTRLSTLPDYMKVYPGHGPVSTIGDEKRFNPFLKNFDWEF